MDTNRFHSQLVAHFLTPHYATLTLTFNYVDYASARYVVLHGHSKSCPVVKAAYRVYHSTTTCRLWRHCSNDWRRRHLQSCPYLQRRNNSDCLWCTEIIISVPLKFVIVVKDSSDLISYYQLGMMTIAYTELLVFTVWSLGDRQLTCCIPSASSAVSYCCWWMVRFHTFTSESVEHRHNVVQLTCHTAVSDLSPRVGNDFIIIGRRTALRYVRLDNKTACEQSWHYLASYTISNRFDGLSMDI